MFVSSFKRGIRLRLLSLHGRGSDAKEMSMQARRNMQRDNQSMWRSVSYVVVVLVVVVVVVKVD